MSPAARNGGAAMLAVASGQAIVTVMKFGSAELTSWPDNRNK